MPSSNGPATVDSLSQYACDFCHRKKLKCSRELPKCNNCKPWPGSCEYTRDSTSNASRRKRPAPSSPERQNLASQKTTRRDAIDDRLNSLEEAVLSVTKSVDQALQDRNTPTSIKDPAPNLPLSDHNVTLPRNRSGPGLYFGASRSNATDVSSSSTPQTAQSNAREVAYSELQQLSTAAKLAPREATPVQNDMKFYIPPRHVGYRLISKYFEDGEAGQAFFSLPPDEIVRQVIFEPHRVQEKAWIVSVNYMLLSALSAENVEASLVEKLRRNTQLALNDSGIFLEPSMANVQALALLALHGEDYAAPSLSWMLLGHACRQAEVLGLHAPGAHDASRQQKLCLFWLLFMADKSCALSFGRPAFLPTTAYRDVPVPDEDFLLTFRPHENHSANRPPNPDPGCNFGAHLINRSIKMSKICGTILDLLTTGASTETKRTMQKELEHWHENTNRILVDDMTAGEALISDTQRQEMSLGVNSLKFQYLHVLILLLKGSDHSSTLRLNSSREAIALLPSMVSNWSSVYNGVVWQLLYYPFIPFFVIFEAITHHRGPLNSSIKKDLDLLSTTVSYYQSMRSEVHVLATVCARLQHVANTFLQLAQTHSNKEASKSTSEGFVQLQARGANQRGREPALEQSDVTRTGKASTSPGGLVENNSTQAPDMNDFLEWMPSDLSAFWSDFDGEQPSSAIAGFGSELNDHQASAQRGRSVLDGTFDWFSWDAYYKTVQ